MGMKTEAMLLAELEAQADRIASLETRIEEMALEIHYGHDERDRAELRAFIAAAAQAAAITAASKKLFPSDGLGPYQTKGQ